MLVPPETLNTTGMSFPGSTDVLNTPLVSINASACGSNGEMVCLGLSSFLVGPKKYPWSTASMTV
jgi:hypothetical protein